MYHAEHAQGSDPVTSMWLWYRVVAPYCLHHYGLVGMFFFLLLLGFCLFVFCFRDLFVIGCMFITRKKVWEISRVKTLQKHRLPGTGALFRV